MYDPVGLPRLTRRGKLVVLFVILGVVAGIVVTVLRTMPHPPPAAPLTLEQLELMDPDAAQTALVAAIVRARIDHPDPTPTPSASAAAPAAACVAATPPHGWDPTQRANAKTIVQVGVALSVPARGEVVALAVAMQESKLNNLGHLANNDHDSLGLFQQRPSMGWGSPAQLTDPVFAATAFYLALKRVPKWESLAVTVAGQRVQRSAFPNSYAQWEADANALFQAFACNAL